MINWKSAEDREANLLVVTRARPPRGKVRIMSCPTCGTVEDVDFIDWLKMEQARMLELGTPTEIVETASGCLYLARRG